MDLFYGTDYHSHLGTCRGGLAVRDNGAFTRFIHDITNAQFRSKFEDDLPKMTDGPALASSATTNRSRSSSFPLGTYAIVTVGIVMNSEALAREAFNKRTTHFSEMSGGGINPTELVATLINQEATFADGIRHALARIEAPARCCC